MSKRFQARDGIARRVVRNGGTRRHNAVPRPAPRRQGTRGDVVRAELRAEGIR